jgi:exopolyphosphatase/guanosine-5'-triphosphate,3'-diphosphate pyrophosphatase
VRLGVLDIGSNTVHLLVADVHPGGRPQATTSRRTVLRLMRHLTPEGAIDDAGVRALTAAVAEARQMAEREGVARLLATATSAVREASNGADVIARLEDALGQPLQVLGGEDEARFTFLAVRRWFGWSAGQILLFDIGGGSTEAVLLEQVTLGHSQSPSIRMDCWVSVPWGVVSLGETEQTDAGSPAHRLEAYVRMKARVAEHLAPLKARLKGEVQLLGASGTVTTLASLNMGLPQYDRRQVDGSLASTSELVALSHDLAVKSPDERAMIPGIGADRADLVVAGAAILEALIDLGSAPRLRVADRGIREGILRSMMARDDGRNSARQ